MTHVKLDNSSNPGLAEFAHFGIRVLTGNSIIGETFNAIQAVTDSVISSELTQLEGFEGDSSITSLELTSGMVIYGRFVNIQVSSGKIIAYKG